MDGWADSEPAWWLNLQAHPEPSIDLADGRRAITGRAAQGEERSRLGPDSTDWTRTSTYTLHSDPPRQPTGSWNPAHDHGHAIDAG
jgi:hypothetical protein